MSSSRSMRCGGSVGLSAIDDSIADTCSEVSVMDSPTSVQSNSSSISSTVDSNNSDMMNVDSSSGRLRAHEWWSSLTPLDKTSHAFNFGINPADTPPIDILEKMCHNSIQIPTNNNQHNVTRKTSFDMNPINTSTITPTTISHETQTDINDLCSTTPFHTPRTISINNQFNEPPHNINKLSARTPCITSTTNSQLHKDIIPSGGKKELSINVDLANGDEYTNQQSNIPLGSTQSTTNTSTSDSSSNTIISQSLQSMNIPSLNYSPAMMMRTPQFVSPHAYTFASPFASTHNRSTRTYMTSPALPSGSTHTPTMISSSIPTDKVDASQQTEQLRSQLLSPLPQLTSFNAQIRTTSLHTDTNSVALPSLLSPLHSTIGTQSHTSFNFFSPARALITYNTHFNSMNGTAMLFSPPAVASVSMFSPMSMSVPTPANNAGNTAASGLSNLANAHKRVFNFQVSPNAITNNNSSNGVISPTKALQDVVALASASASDSPSDPHDHLSMKSELVTADTAETLHDLASSVPIDVDINGSDSDELSDFDVKLSPIHLNTSSSHNSNASANSIDISYSNTSNKNKRNATNTQNTIKHKNKPSKSAHSHSLHKHTHNHLSNDANDGMY